MICGRLHDRRPSALRLGVLEATPAWHGVRLRELPANATGPVSLLGASLRKTLWSGDSAATSGGRGSGRPAPLGAWKLRRRSGSAENLAPLGSSLLRHGSGTPSPTPGPWSRGRTFARRPSVATSQRCLPGVHNSLCTSLILPRLPAPLQACPWQAGRARSDMGFALPSSRAFPAHWSGPPEEKGSRAQTARAPW